MAAAPDAGRLAAACSQVRQACDLLIHPTPEALNQCQKSLEEAIAAFAASQGGDSVAAGTRADHMALRREVLCARGLLDRLANFYRGWERVLGTMAGGYTASGEPVAVDRAGQLCCRG